MPLSLGQHIRYIQEIPGKEQTHIGGGRIKAIFLDANNRPMVMVQCDTRLNDDKSPLVFNTPVPCINASEEFANKFQELVGQIDELAAKAEKENLRIVGKFNKKIDVLKDKLLGEVVSF